MSADLRGTHERDGEVQGRVYVGCRFKNDTERVDKLLNLCTKMTEEASKERARRWKA